MGHDRNPEIDQSVRQFDGMGPAFEFDCVGTRICEKTTSILDRCRLVDSETEEWHVSDNQCAGGTPNNGRRVTRDLFERHWKGRIVPEDSIPEAITDEENVDIDGRSDRGSRCIVRSDHYQRRVAVSVSDVGDGRTHTGDKVAPHQYRSGFDPKPVRFRCDERAITSVKARVRQTEPTDGIDYGWIMQVTFVATIVVGAPIVALLSLGVDLPTWSDRARFAVAIGSVIWFITGVVVYAYARLQS